MADLSSLAGLLENQGRLSILAQQQAQQGTLPPMRDRDPCPKCGYLYPNPPKYHRDAWRLFGCRFRVEHLHFECGSCGAEWTGPPRDWKA